MQSENVKKVKCSKYGMESFLLSPGAKRNAEKKKKYRTKKINNCFQLLLAEIKDRSSAENRQIGRICKRITSNCLQTKLKGK